MHRNHFVEYYNGSIARTALINLGALRKRDEFGGMIKSHPGPYNLRQVWVRQYFICWIYVLFMMDRGRVSGSARFMKYWLIRTWRTKRPCPIHTAKIYSCIEIVFFFGKPSTVPRLGQGAWLLCVKYPILIFFVEGGCGAGVLYAFLIYHFLYQSVYIIECTILIKPT